MVITLDYTFERRLELQHEEGRIAEIKAVEEKILTVSE
jgi:hypothetical protein